MNRATVPRRSLRLVIAGIATVTLAALFVGGAVAVTGDDSGRYRVSTAEIGHVTETVATSGTIDATVRRDIAVAVAGSVEGVNIATGDTVSAGEVLVTLDREAAERAVRKAQASLAQAEAELESAQDAQAGVVASAAGTGATPGDGAAGLRGPSTAPNAPDGSGRPSSTPSAVPTSDGQDGAPTSRPPTDQPTGEPTAEPTGEPTDGGTVTPVEPVPSIELPSISQLRALQDAVTTAQSAVSGAVADASAALAAQSSACASAYGRGAGGSADEDAAPGDDAVNDACDAALAAVQAAQQSVSDQQGALQTALNSLTDALVAAVSQTEDAVALLQGWLDENDSGGTTGAGKISEAAMMTTGGQADAYSVTVHSSGIAAVEQVSQTGSAAATNSSRVTASTPDASGVAAAAALSVARAQASIDQAKADLLAAEQDLAATEVVTTVPGTVTAVNVSAGATVSAGEVLVTVIADAGATVTLSLDSTAVRQVAAGQDAEVTLPGATQSVTGEVVWVSRVSARTSGSFPFSTGSTYSADVHVPTDAIGEVVLPQGARAEVSITTGTREEVITVPTSAVLRQSESSTVQVLGADGLTTRTVETGLIGAGRTEIVSGIEPGDQVVLADLEAEIDAVGQVSTGSTGFPGGFPGAGGGAGLPRGMPGR